MSDHSKPVIGSTYANYTLEFMARIDDAVKQNRTDTVTLTQPPVGTIRFNTTTRKWEGNTGTAGTPAWTALDSAGAYGIRVATADAWQTARTITLTSDVTGVSAAFDGSGNISFATTLVTANASPGTYGGANAVPVVTVDAKGRVTTVTTATITGVGTVTTGTWNATVVAAAYGGTGQSSYTVGDLLYASGATTVSKLADVATGSVLISGGVGVAPSYGKVGLTTHVSGTLAVANGGTGVTTITGLIKGNGTGAMTAAVAGTDYQAVLVSGTNIKTLNSTSLLGLGNIVITGAPTLSVETGTAVTAVANTQHVLTNVAATTVTLNASPAAGDIIAVTIANGLNTNIINRNGKSIEGLAEDLTLNVTAGTIWLRYVDATRMWRLF